MCVFGGRYVGDMRPPPSSYYAQTLGGGSCADTSEQEAADIDDNLEGQFRPVGQGNFCFAHNFLF